MGKNRQQGPPQPGRGGGGGRGAGKGGGRGVPKGIAKASHNSTSVALGKAIAEARRQQQSTASGSGGGLLLAQLSETACDAEETSVEQILDIVRECIGDSASSMALTALGDQVRARTSRMSEMAGLHKQVRDKWGGWESFLKAHAANEYVVVKGVVHAREQATTMTVEEEAAPARSLEPVARRDVNELSLDAAAL